MKIQPPRLHFRKQAGIRADLETLLLKYCAKAKLALNPGYGEHPVAGVVNCDLHCSKASIVANISPLSMYADESVQLTKLTCSRAPYFIRCGSCNSGVGASLVHWRNTSDNIPRSRSNRTSLAQRSAVA